MDCNTYNKYPDYMKDFKEIKKLTAVQEFVLNRVRDLARNYIAQLKFETVGAERWMKIYKLTDHTNETTYLKVFHKRHILANIENIEEYVQNYINKQSCTLSYDREHMTFVLKIKKGNEKHLDYIRKLLPCNLLLEVVLVEKLDEDV